MAKSLFAVPVALVCAWSAVSAPVATAASGGADAWRQAPAPKQYDAIVALNNCSGSLVRFPTTQTTDKAMVLTNGHCVETGKGMMKAGVAFHNKASKRTFTLLEGDTPTKVGTLTADKIMYGTMTGTDAAIYQLNETYEALDKRLKPTVPRLIVDKKSAVGTKFDIPSGFWKQTWKCEIHSYVPHLKEADYRWTDSIKYSMPCRVKGGSSGSPITDQATGEVIGINNTINESGQQCTLNNPCETDESGKATFYKKDQGYGQHTYIFLSCLSADRQIDLKQPGCTLFKDNIES